MQWMCGRGVALLLVPTLLQHTASSSASSDDADPATPAGLLTGTKQRGLRWAVNFPDAVEPFLLGSNPGRWANTSRSVADVTVGIVVQPVFSIPTSGELVTLMPSKLPPNSSSLRAFPPHFCFKSSRFHRSAAMFADRARLRIEQGSTLTRASRSSSRSGRGSARPRAEAESTAVSSTALVDTRGQHCKASTARRSRQKGRPRLSTVCRPTD